MSIMKPRIELVSQKNLVGNVLKMSMKEDRTFELWSGFMPKSVTLKNTVGTDLYSLQIVEKSIGYKDFDANTEFLKWAAIEVKDFTDIPDGLEAYVLQGGLYAVFLHKGLSSDFHKTMQYIFGQWLPKSDYELDDRVQFAIMGDTYKNNDPSSEEEVFVPIKPR